MTSLLDLNDSVRKILYSCIVLSILFFYYKLARHPQKSYGLLMIVILITSIFLGAAFRLARLFSFYSPLLHSAMMVLGKFDVLWLTSLALYHYSILRTFKGKFRRFPFKAFILYAVLICLAISLVASHRIVESWGGISYVIDVLSAGIFGYIAFKSKHFGNEIQFGPYSVHESASRLYKFALIQACFATVDCVVGLIIEKSTTCSHAPESDFVKYYCAALDFSSLILYQLWVWYAVYFNWKMLVMSRRKDTIDVEPISNSASSNNSQRSSLLNNEEYATLP